MTLSIHAFYCKKEIAAESQISIITKKMFKVGLLRGT